MYLLNEERRIADNLKVNKTSQPCQYSSPIRIAQALLVKNTTKATQNPEFFQMNVYHIKTIDLRDCKDRQDVFNTFSKELSFPDFHRNTCDAFWDSITGLVKKPTNLIIYNYPVFSELCKADSGQLIRIINQYNDQNRDSSIIQLDDLDGLEKNKIESIFKNRPSQFGQRGDPHLWNNLEKSFSGMKVSENEDNLVKEIHNQIALLTGNSTEHQKDYYVKDYDFGGMSGGGISWKFWEKKAIPLLIGRCRKLKLLSEAPLL